MTTSQANKVNVLIVGSGLSGLALALKLADRYDVAVLAKSTFPQTNTAMAQGGIAAVHLPDDTFHSHYEDTLTAGAGLCHPEVVTAVVEQAPQRIEDLLQWGVQFDLNSEHRDFDLTREGGHNARRIFHFADHTGAEIHEQLLTRVRKHPRISLFENHLALELITQHETHPWQVSSNRCLGAYVMNLQTHEISAWSAGATVLATGGAGKVYLYTSNWAGASGDGIALAQRAGCRVANMEFMQFHPTCLYHPNARNFLISEALRGEGGILRTRGGVAFMEKYDSRTNLAPRDIVARSIDLEMKKSGDPCVFLDMTHLSRDFLIQRFPAIYEKCLSHGIDLTKEPIPVVPAAHYLCGGVLTGLNGQTDLPGLFAIGETSCTGLHGANRLASNSLLECLVMAHECGTTLLAEKVPESRALDLKWSALSRPDPDELVVVSHTWDELRRLMWNYVGIVRSNYRLERAARRIENILNEVQVFADQYKTHPDLIELRNLSLVASLTVDCASRRLESRGIHLNLDFPETSKEAKDTIISRAARC